MDASTLHGGYVRYARFKEVLAHIGQTQYQSHSRYSELLAKYKLIKQLPIHYRLDYSPGIYNLLLHDEIVIDPYISRS